MIRTLLCAAAAFAVGCWKSAPDDTKEGRAVNDMLAIKKVYETFYAQQSRWPKDPSEVYPLLEQGQQAFQSPWPGVMYQVQFQEIPGKDGKLIERPVVTCQPPGKPVIQVPDPTKNK
jgi:hypothetical protein